MDKPSRRSVLAFLVPATVLALVLPRQAMADKPEFQVHMRAALDALHVAQKELAIAEADKGGFRVKAQKSVALAVLQVERGINYDNHH